MQLNVPILEGHGVQLIPLEESHREALRGVADDARLWQFTSTRGDGPAFDPWFDAALADREAGKRFPFAVRTADGFIGSTGYLDITLTHKRIEIGATWYRVDSWGTTINPACKFLLLEHAFEVLGVNRVSLVTDSRNTRSQAAIAKLGATREGVLRSHMVVQGGYVRDTVVFSIVAAEWPAVRDGLLGRLS